MKNIIKNKNLTFIDIDFHKKTKSGYFLINLFSKYFKINLVWVKSKKNRFIFNPDSKNLKENIFFFQFLPDFITLFKLRKKKIIWAPMYDDIKKKNYFFWFILSLYDISIISFSKKINDLCKEHKINFLFARYFPNVKKNKSKKSKKVSIFFWYRGTVKISDWIYSLNSNQVKEVVYYNLKDPNFFDENISLNLKRKYNIKFYYGKFRKTNSIYKKLWIKSDIYVAPREREGIGHSFLEAMSEGKYILSKNEETMNEYITSPIMGNFFGNKIDIKKVINSYSLRYKQLKKLERNWKDKEIKIIRFINN